MERRGRGGGGDGQIQRTRQGGNIWKEMRRRWLDWDGKM